MVTQLFDSAKKVFRRGSSSTKVVSNHPLRSNDHESSKMEDTTVPKDVLSRGGGPVSHSPNPQPTREPIQRNETDHSLRNNESCSVPKGQHHESLEDTTTVRKDVPSRGGAVSRTQNPQLAREPMHVFPRKEITPPKNIQTSSYRARQNSMREFRTLPGEKKGLQGQLLEMQDTLNTVLNTSEARMNEIKRLDSLLRSMVSAGKEAESKICDLERKIQVQDEDIRNLRQRLRTSEEQCSQKTKLLNERTAELKGAQAFLTTADRYSGADIIKMAESLNAEIFQASALMAELLVDAPVMEDPVQQRQYIQGYKSHLDDCRKIIGPRLFDHLVTKSNEIRTDPLPLQLAFQALFAWWCNYEVDRFCDGPTGKSLKQIYRRIHESEIQAVAGRWRVMTSVQTMDSDTREYAEFVINVIVGLMCICGGFGLGTSKRAIPSIQQAVLRVERMWRTLKAATMQEITAAEITVIHLGAGCDYNAAKMDDVYMDTSSDASSDATANPDKCGQCILCTIGVGLRRGVSKRSESGMMQIHQEVILKPKVALASVLVDGEPPDIRAMDRKN